MSNDRVNKHLPVVLSLVVALMLAIAPMPEWLETFRPDWIALTLIYWSISFPHNYSVGAAWAAGLVIDVAHGTLLGQHALAMSIVIYVTVKFHLQFRQFPTLQLTATVFALIALYQFILFWVNGVAGINAPVASYWGPVIGGTLLWPQIAMLLVGVRQRARR